METSKEEIKKKVLKLHIEDGRTISSLASEYGVCKATISNWVRSCREECYDNDAAKSEIELMEENRKLRLQLQEAKKENDFLKKAAAFFAKKID